ncbi:uncharacterized protein HD556DRAFT_1306360 [Suillus plorans]|uniref:Uncharacterized protein n=1 Tax=Suillus plorans TaxID=116603 RepID=A0A9P7DLE2_9AGAM|nr:uncharacterized protein HD556DRAFT_1306360 [Suillus plorans]KAG1797742.1 hypothetical protein HD556DRAFT_1306360 [Suillus plorans]
MFVSHPGQWNNPEVVGSAYRAVPTYDPPAYFSTRCCSQHSIRKKDPLALEVLMTDPQLMPPRIICTDLRTSSTGIGNHCCWFADTVKNRRHYDACFLDKMLISLFYLAFDYAAVLHSIFDVFQCDLRHPQVISVTGDRRLMEVLIDMRPITPAVLLIKACCVIDGSRWLRTPMMRQGVGNQPCHNVQVIDQSTGWCQHFP